MASEKSNAEALEYYNKSTKIKAQAGRFFSAMDTNGDGAITKKEFSSFLEKSKFLSKWIEHDRMFADADKDNSGELDFDEYITFIHKVFTWFVCDGCGQEFAQGKAHLTCVKCFRNGRRSFDLCSSCHSAKNYKHEHKDFQEFGPLVSEYVGRIETFGNSFITFSTVIEIARNITSAVKTVPNVVEIVSAATGVNPAGVGAAAVGVDTAGVGAAATGVDPAGVGAAAVGVDTAGVGDATTGVDPAAFGLDPDAIGDGVAMMGDLGAAVAEICTIM